MAGIGDDDDFARVADTASERMEIAIEFVVDDMVLPFVLPLDIRRLRIVRYPRLVQSVGFISVDIGYLLPMPREMDINDVERLRLVDKMAKCVADSGCSSLRIGKNDDVLGQETVGKEDVLDQWDVFIAIDSCPSAACGIRPYPDDQGSLGNRRQRATGKEGDTKA